MNGDFIKITAKKDTWFKEGTEVFAELAGGMYGRPNLEQFSQIVKDCAHDFYGVRIVEYESESSVFKMPIGTERMDCEWCNVDEFMFEVCYESKEVKPYE